LATNFQAEEGEILGLAKLNGLEKPHRPRETSISFPDAALVLEAHDRLKIDALTFETVLKHIHGLIPPHSRIHIVFKENSRAFPQPSEQ